VFHSIIFLFFAVESMSQFKPWSPLKLEALTCSVHKTQKICIYSRDVCVIRILTAAYMKLRVFWNVAPCSHVEVDRRFRGSYYLHNQDDDDRGNTHL
jgi:hypothetical protein